VNGEFVAQGAARARGLDRVHIAENVGNGDVRRGQFFDETRSRGSHAMGVASPALAIRSRQARHSGASGLS
jgi:hypothetical protein